MKSTLLLFTIVLFMSCSSTKNTKETMDKTQTSMEAKKMIEKGFLAGTIVVSTKEGECPFTIKVKGDEDAFHLDPINLDESFKRDGQKVWFTYNGLRMMNRCDNANPISIKEIQKRAE